jgi:hypothetical protein
MADHPIIWTAPEPLWAEAVDRGMATRTPLTAPAILRFANDDFMSEFTNVLASDPRRLGEYRVVRETWRGVLKSAPATTPTKLFTQPLQRLGAARQRSNGSAPIGQGRKPQPNADAIDTPLKLYQPAHQRYYLITSCLVCQQFGLPDRKVDAGKQEKIGFVMRRLLAPATGTELDPEKWSEHAWVDKNGVRIWRPVPAESAESLIEGEEVLPLFAVNHAQDDQRQRRMFAGLIPVGKREAFLGASGGPANSSGGVTSQSARKALLRTEIIEPWKQLLGRAARKRLELAGVEAEKQRPVLKVEREQIQTSSWLILLDLADFLENQLTNVWSVIRGEGTESALEDKEKRVLTALRHAVLGGQLKARLKLKSDASGAVIYGNQSFPASLFDALREFTKPLVGKDAKAPAPGTTRVKDSAAAKLLESATAPYDRDAPDPTSWPDFLFPLADASLPLGVSAEANSMQAPLPPDSALPAMGSDDPELVEESFLDSAPGQGKTLPQGPSQPDQLVDYQDARLRVDKLAVLILRALPAEAHGPEPAIPTAARQPADAFTGWFVIRCVYSRPACGPLHDDVLSPRTEKFQLAGFFDPDAPARPIRIGLPVDTTPAGLRKFDKNAALVISDTLCGQIARVKEMSLGDLVLSVLPFPLHKDLNVPDKGPCSKGPNLNFGMICSISIPIITLCALILLMIMVSLLDIIFRWVPYFIVCFPVPGFKAKKP